MTTIIRIPGVEFTHFARRLFDIQDVWAGGRPGWLVNPGDFSSLSQDIAGAVPVTAVGQPVGRAMDLSGNGLHFTQATAEVRPILQQDGDGFYYLDVTGGKRLQSAYVDLSAHRHLALLSGFMHNKPGGNWILMMGLSTAPAAAPGSCCLFVNDYLSAASMMSFLKTATGTGFYSGGPISAGEKGVIAARFDTQGAAVSDRIRPRLNGVIPALSSGGYDPGPFDSTFGSAYPFVIGDSAFDGRFYPQMAVAGDVSADDLLLAEQWINARTGAY